ncbi:MAG: hypothetical protein ABW321_06965 [Polyangiales bacterium]
MTIRRTHVYAGRWLLGVSMGLTLVGCSFDDTPIAPEPPALPSSPAPVDAGAAQPEAGSNAAAGGEAPPVLPPMDAAVAVPPSAAPDAATAPAPGPTPDAAAPLGPSNPPGCQVDCTTIVGIEAKLQLIATDLDALPSAEERADVRYLDLTPYANAGHGDAELALHREALAFLVNSLSRGPLVVRPQAIDPQSLLFRIRLSDYGWSAASWELVAERYPFAVSYDPSSRVYAQSAVLLERIREQVGTQVPYVNGDWFFSRAVRPPLYYDLLAVPVELRTLEIQLGVDIRQNIDDQLVARAGFVDSGPSANNRVIERHVLSDNRGALWLTYDFDSSSGLSNVLAHPLDFNPTGSQMIFSLPNGLHAYTIVDDRGVRLDKAPSGIQDRAASDFAMEAGLSCVHCHARGGVIIKQDEVRGALMPTATDIETRDQVLALYKDAPELDALFGADQARYATALAVLQLQVFGDGSAHQLDDAYTAALPARAVAAALGVPEAELLQQLQSSPGAFPIEALPLRTPSGTLPRDVLEARFADLVAPLGLGAVLQP